MLKYQQFRLSEMLKNYSICIVVNFEYCLNQTNKDNHIYGYHIAHIWPFPSSQAIKNHQNLEFHSNYHLDIPKHDKILGHVMSDCFPLRHPSLLRLMICSQYEKMTLLRTMTMMYLHYFCC